VNFRGKALVQSGRACFNKATIRVCRTCSLWSPLSIEFTSQSIPKKSRVEATYHQSPKDFLSNCQNIVAKCILKECQLDE